MTVIPISPMLVKENNIPDEVVETVNELIMRKWRCGRAVIFQNEIIEILENKMKITRQEIFNNRYLDFENLFREYGWNVEYDKPHYTDNNEAMFIFKK
jgi:hypothetical protein